MDFALSDNSEGVIRKIVVTFVKGRGDTEVDFGDGGFVGIPVEIAWGGFCWFWGGFWLLQGLFNGVF